MRLRGQAPSSSAVHLPEIEEWCVYILIRSELHAGRRTVSMKSFKAIPPRALPQALAARL